MSQAAVDEAVVFSAMELQKQLRQAEIISDVTQWIYDSASGRVKKYEHHFVVIASQDCDLERDFEAKMKGELFPLNGILLYEAYTVDKAKTAMNPKILKEAYQNNHERYAFVEACEAASDVVGQGFGGLIVDFRRHFTIDSVELYRQIDTLHGPRRRARLLSPYCEHFQNRLGHYLQRVALPRNHQKPTADAA